MKHLILSLVLMAQSAQAANNVSADIESRMSGVASQAITMKQEADFIAKAYFATTASSLVGAAATNGTAVTVGSKLTKSKFIDGITMAQAIQNFFTNQAVGQGDYMSTSLNLINGSLAAAEPLSQDVEAIGTKLVVMGNTMIEVRKFCQGILASYNSSELAASLVPVSLNTVVFGGSTTKQKFVDGMNFCQQLMNLMDNSAVTQGDWISVAMKWSS